MKSSRVVASHVLCILAGAALFFLVFAAVFNGLWLLLILFVLMYGLAGAGGVAFGKARPQTIALALIAPALPWLLWLFPASIPEAGLFRAMLWPASVAILFSLAWLGGWIVAGIAARRARVRGAA